MDIDVLRERPFLTGLLLGLIIFLLRAGVRNGELPLGLFAVGVVLAIFGESWYRPAGQAFAGAGATVLLLEALYGLAWPLLRLVS
ncbi:MAG: hypothetical protein ABEJ06_02295 [Haloarculaceae archaeon]